MKDFSDLDLAVAEAEDVEGRRARFETGESVTFHYYRRNEQATRRFYFGARFGQDVEPSGRYMSFHARDDNVDVPGLELGIVTFKRPLVLYWDGYGDDGWKARLSRRFGGRRGRAPRRRSVMGASTAS